MAKAMEKMIPHIFKDEFNLLNIIDIPILPIKNSQLFQVGYDESGLEGQLFKYLLSDDESLFEADEPKLVSKLRGKKFATLKDLKDVNPHLRVCLVSCVMNLDDVNGPSFSPRIFDTENPNDYDKTVMSVARATSAAPTFFRPSKVLDTSPDGEKTFRTFIDGGVFANNPAGWGLALAAQKIKAENIRMLSVGTGYPKLKQKKLSWEEQEKSLLDPSRYLDWINKKVQGALGPKLENISEGGALGMFNMQFLNMLVLDMQKTSEQVLELYKNVLGGNYHRLNPPMKKEIGISDPKSAPAMKTDALDYLSEPETKQQIRDAVAALLKPDNYVAKAQSSIERAAHLFAYADKINQILTDEEILQAAIYAKLIAQKFESVPVTQEQLEAARLKVEEDLAKTSQLYRDDTQYPQRQPTVRAAENSNVVADDETLANNLINA
eukprot:403339893